MSLAENLHQCCKAEPEWIFVYSDGSVFAICSNDMKNHAYQFGVIEVINIKTQESFTPESLFGGEF